nr:unnamed protein product [Callosobruchus analis]
MIILTKEDCSTFTEVSC